MLYNMDTKNKHIWEFLPWNIQVDILSRLSTKDLCEFQSVCKDWQSIIKSPRFHMLQINANPNQDAIIIHSKCKGRKGHIQPLNSSKIYKFDIPSFGPNLIFDFIQYLILDVSNGLVLVITCYFSKSDQLLVYNPTTKEYIELPRLPKPLDWNLPDLLGKFFEHDLQFSTYKIFFIFHLDGYIYQSSSHTWQSLNSLCNFRLNRQFETFPSSCVTYKNNIYMISDIYMRPTLHKVELSVYDPINDAWNKLDLNINIDGSNYHNYDGKLIIANDSLFLVIVCSLQFDIYILIFEMKIEDRLFIPIIKIIRPRQMQSHMGSDLICGLDKKIFIFGYMKDVNITYNVSTNEQEELKYDDSRTYVCIRSGNHICTCDNTGRKGGFYPFKYTLVSPKCRET